MCLKILNNFYSIKIIRIKNTYFASYPAVFTFHARGASCGAGTGSAIERTKTDGLGETLLMFPALSWVHVRTGRFGRLGLAALTALLTIVEDEEGVDIVGGLYKRIGKGLKNQFYFKKE